MFAMLAALAMGALFGIGLQISGMTDPANVKGFLDIFGSWRPQLIAVLGVGMAVTTLLYLLAHRRMRPFAEPAFHWPATSHVDRSLVLGAILFGAGWAIAGYCPGPALVGAGALNPVAAVFVLAMLAGGFFQRRGADNRGLS